MRLILFLIALIGTTDFAVAQASGVVRAGEHDGFSRLVIYLNAENEWDLRQEGSNYVLKVEGWTSGFDVSSVFNNIPRTRILNLRASEDEITVELGCSCEAETSLYESRAIVIDFKDVQRERSQESTKKVDNQLSIANRKNKNRSFSINRIVELDLITDQFDSSNFSSTFTDKIQKVEKYTASNKDEPGRIQYAEDFQGQEIYSHLNFHKLQSMEGVNIKNKPSILYSKPDMRDNKKEEISCLQVQYFKIENWSDGRVFQDQLADLRSTLYEDFDAQNIASARDLARLYLHFGFGYEAVEIIQAFNFKHEERNLLLLIAGIIEPSSTLDAPRQTRLEGCGDSASLWEFLSGDHNSNLALGEVKAMSSIFLGWPENLQSLIGPKLINQFLNSGFENDADILNNALTRNLHESDLEVLPLYLNAKNEPVKIFETLSQVIKERSEDVPIALKEYFSQVLTLGGRFKEGDLEILSSYIEELDGAASSIELQDLRLEVMASGGLFDGLISELDNRDTKASSVTLNRVASRLLSGEEAEGPLRLALFLRSKGRLEELSDKMLFGYALSLLESGFPEVALNLLELKEFDNPNSRLKAKALIALNRFTEANKVLDGLATSDSEQLQAELQLKSDQATRSPSTIPDSVTPAIRDQLYWANGSWGKVDQSGKNGEIATLILSSQNTNEQGTSLSDARHLSQKSIDSQSAVRKLLNIEN